jgi:hypothetical protein
MGGQRGDAAVSNVGVQPDGLAGRRVVVQAAHRFHPPELGGGYEGPENLKAKLALLVALNPEHFESRDVAAWTAYLRNSLGTVRRGAAGRG